MTDRDHIEKLVKMELEEANETYPLFHSAHEAYAVLLEEVEELIEDVEDIKSRMNIMWIDIKGDWGITHDADALRNKAIHAIQEAIQVAAMCDKMKLSNIK